MMYTGSYKHATVWTEKPPKIQYQTPRVKTVLNSHASLRGVHMCVMYVCECVSVGVWVWVCVCMCVWCVCVCVMCMCVCYLPKVHDKLTLHCLNDRCIIDQFRWSIGFHFSSVYCLQSSVQLILIPFLLLYHTIHSKWQSPCLNVNCSVHPINVKCRSLLSSIQML